MRALDYKEAIRLRMLGKSYNEIAKDLDVGKSLLSYWLRDLELPKEAKKILEEKSNYPKEKFAEYNRQKHEFVIKENKEIRENSLKKVKVLKDYEMLLLGAALYWGEGQKRHEGKRVSPHIAFTNSDPDMVKFFLHFVKGILQVPEEKIKGLIHIYPNIVREDAIRFWSNITGISINNFSITKSISRASHGKRSKNLLPYGTLTLRVSSRKKFFEIMGLIDGLVKQGT